MSVIEVVAAALHAACLRDLPDIEHEVVDGGAERAYLDRLSQEDRAAYYENRRQAAGGLSAFYASHGLPVYKRKLRPSADACDVTVFRQSWSSTALGYGGIGGQAFTHAYTVVVECDSTGYRAVYFGGGRLAYLVPPGVDEDAYLHYMATRFFPSVADARLHGWHQLLVQG